jgi:predicted acylesterase/phospholipase RssA
MNGSPTPGIEACAPRAQEAVPNESKDVFPWTLELALSGGGLRATAFCLGALLYIAHAGLNNKVRNIASVSGGSITNGFVACRCDYGTVDIGAFRDQVASELARRIAHRGMYKSIYVWCYSGAVATLALLLAASCMLSFSILSRLWIVAGPFLMVLIYFRGWPIDKWMTTTFFSNMTATPTLAHLSNRTIDHVFCATDLNRAVPFFFSTAKGGRLFSERYGQAPAPLMPIQVAVRSSAAFPPLIPPTKFKPLADWNMLGKKISSPRIWLSDGGVFNNFGTDWGRLRDTVWFTFAPNEASNADRRAAHLRGFGQVQLIVEASQPAPPKKLFLLNIPVLAFFCYVFRVMDVMYGSTLTGRREGAEHEARSRMMETPKKWRIKEYDRRRAAAPPYEEELDPEGQVRGGLKIYVPLALQPFELLQKWGGFSAAYSEEPGLRSFSLRTELERAEPLFGDLWPTRETVATTFKSLGRRHTLRVVVHGYLMTREALTSAFVPYEPLPIPQPSWFEELLAS